MEYVMVPVPEEHVVDVMQHVARLVARAAVAEWAPPEVEEFFDEVDEPTRALLSLVARGISDGKDTSDEDAAETLELNVREVRSICRDVIEASQRRQRHALMGMRDASVALPNGRTVERRLFTMIEQNARTIKAHERASITGGRAQPAGDPG